MKDKKAFYSQRTSVHVLFLLFLCFLSLGIFQSFFDSSSIKKKRPSFDSATVENLEQRVNFVTYPKSKQERLERIGAFKSNHERIVRSLEPKKFAYVIPDTGGYGNKLTQVISALTVALITDSALIINITEINKYIHVPLYDCFQTSQWTNNELNYLYDPNGTFLMPKWTTVSWSPQKNLKDLFLNIPTDKHNRFVFDGMCSLYFEIACNKNYFDKFLYYGLVSIKTIENALLVLDSSSYNNINSSEHNLNVLYQVGFELANSIMDLFWQPANFIQKQVDIYMKENFKGNFVIGMQIRFEFLSWNDTRLFFECAKYVEIVAGITTRKPIKW
jgi:hypothetical protein